MTGSMEILLILTKIYLILRLKEDKNKKIWVKLKLLSLELAYCKSLFFNKRYL